MNILLAFCLFLSITFFTQLNAAVYKGQKEFFTKCVECHNDPFIFLKSKTKNYWVVRMKEKGKLLAHFHIKNINAKKSWAYFKSKRYNKNARHLSDFLQEYTKDSDNIPTFN